jgi:hypothetical protein
MKTEREMLKGAIAEARTVKETAIVNAKLALEEAITPQLKSMLAKRLEEMEAEEMEESEVEEMKGKEMKETMKSEMEEAISDEMEEAYDMDEEMDLDEILAELEKELEETNIDPGVEPKSFLKKKPDVAQLEEEELTEGEDMTEQEDEMEMDSEMEDDEEIDLEDMSEEDLKSFIEDVIKSMVEAGELEAGDEFETEGGEAEGEEEIEMEDEAEEIMEGEEEMEEALDLGITDAEFIASLLGGVALVGGIAAAEAKKELAAAAKKGKDAVAATMKKLLGKGDVAEMEEITTEVESLKNEINEVNLLNAKLLYLNKIFRIKNLTESQKAKIIPAFDKATTVKEAKLIFETISENLSDSRNPIKENRSLASKPVGVAPKKEMILEVDSQVARWQKLAGIKN